MARPKDFSRDWQDIPINLRTGKYYKKSASGERQARLFSFGLAKECADFAKLRANIAKSGLGRNKKKAFYGQPIYRQEKFESIR